MLLARKRGNVDDVEEDYLEKKKKYLERLLDSFMKI